MSRTVLRKTTSDPPKRIKIRPFITTPARIEVEMGTWFPTGDMAGAKVTVRVSLPCYVEEITEVFEEARNLADDLLDKECDRLTGD